MNHNTVSSKEHFRQRERERERNKEIKRKKDLEFYVQQEEIRLEKSFAEIGKN